MRKGSKWIKRKPKKQTMEECKMKKGLALVLTVMTMGLGLVGCGGSSLITSYMLIGILLNVSSKRQKTIFVK